MPDMWMDVDTALAEVPVNIMPLLNDTDFKTREEAVVYNAAGMDLTWNFTTTAGATAHTAVTPTTAGDYDWTNQGDGMYTIEIPASAGVSINNDTEGFGWFTGFATGVLPWRGPTIGLRAADLNNALIDGGDNLDVNTVQWLGQAVTLSAGNKPDVNMDELKDGAQSATDLQDFADAGYDPATNKVQGVVLADTVTALTGHTPQTGDNYTRLGAPAGANVSADIAAVEAQTDDIGVAGAGLTAVPWNAAWDAQVESEATDALNAYDGPTNTEMNARTLVAANYGTAANQTTLLNRIGAFAGSGFNTILGFFQALMRSDATTPSDLGGTYDDATDSVQAIRDRGDAAWTTGGGGSSPVLLQNTTIATLASQTEFTLTDGSPDNDPYNGALAIVTDATTSTQKAVGIISDYVGGTKTVTLQSDPGIFVMAVGDTVDIVATDKISLAYTAARGGYLDNLNGHTPQTGDSFARLGAPAGASVSADIGDVPTVAEFDARTQPTASYFDPTADEVDLGKVKGTALTETNAGDVADNISQFFDVDPTSTKTIDDVGVAGSSLTEQQVRDAMKLAPTGGAPAAGSVDEHLDDTSLEANVQGYAAAALTAYDPPTNTEMIARTRVTADYFDQTTDNVIVGTNNDKTGYSLSTSGVQAVTDDMLDEVISKSAHNSPNSVGKYIRRISSAFIWEGTAQGPGTGTNQIQLDTGASATDGAYDPASVSIVDGTGAGQNRLILQYAGATRTATVDRDWKVNPDATSEFTVTPNPGRGHVNEGLAQGGTTSSITLNALASSVNNVYIGQKVFIVSGTGADQVGRVTAYNGGTKIATMAQTWTTTPNTTSGYVMSPDAPNLFQGYESAAIWIDTLNGSAGTVAYENGTAENPVNSLADATTLATTLGFSRFRIAPGSSITLAQGYNGFTLGGFGGNGWTLALGGQSISNASIIGAAVSGVCSGANPPTFTSCNMGAVTIPASYIIGCAITGTQTMSGTGDFFYEGCYSGIAGVGSPAIVFSASANLNFRHYSGGIHVQSMAATNNMSLEGDGQIILNANCTGGTVAIRGHFTVTDNAGGAVTLSDNARIDIGQINAQADLALSDYDPPTNAEMTARTLPSAEYGTAANQTTMQTDLDNPNQYKADISALALEATVAALNNLSIADVLTTQMTESYAADGVAPTLAQALFLVQQTIGDFSIAGTTLTAKKLDGSTAAATYTLDSASDPTSRTRAT